jgi:uncharacterized protein
LNFLAADDGATMPAPSDPPRPTAPGPKVAIATPAGAAAVDVEVVATEAKVERGLMYRQNLPPDRGMLFLMGRDYDWRFWMRNTLIGLDIIFIRQDMTVAGIAANAKPRDETLLSVGVPSRYVLEVNAGWAAAHHVTAGSKVSFERVPPR